MFFYLKDTVEIWAMSNIVAQCFDEWFHVLFVCWQRHTHTVPAASFTLFHWLTVGGSIVPMSRKGPEKRKTKANTGVNDDIF